MSKYTTLLFDADGTLLDFNESERQALIKTFQKYHLFLNEDIKELYEKINAELWKQFENGIIDKKTVLYTRFVKLFQKLDIQLDGIAFEDDYQNELGKGAFLLPHTRDVLEHLSKYYDLYIVTNGVSKTQYNRLYKSHIDKYFINIFVSEDIGYQKPMKEYFDYCFARISDFQLKKTLIIGDSLSSDILGGINAGIDTCWIHTAHMTHTTDIIPTYSIRDLRELYDILK